MWRFSHARHSCLVLVFLVLMMVTTVNARYIMYLTGQHNVIPEKSLLSELTHVALAFMTPGDFNHANPTSWPLFTTVADARSKFHPGTQIIVAIGGWGDTDGFGIAAASEESRKLFAKNVAKMVEDTGADGVDIDWEYPGGNGEDYKRHPNSEKAWEVDAYPHLLAEVRAALGGSKIISAAVPGIPRDMIAFTNNTMPTISASVDFFNVMTYDLMNRRDNFTKHHAGIEPSLETVNAFKELGMPFSKMNLGFAFYIKWFKTDPNSTCDQNPIGCKTALMEDPKTGDDLGMAGAFSWHDQVPERLKDSYDKAMKNGIYESKGGGHYYWDPSEQIWWSWETPDAISKKFDAIIKAKGLGGAFAWALGEDGNDFIHYKALTDKVRLSKKPIFDEL